MLLVTLATPVFQIKLGPFRLFDTEDDKMTSRGHARADRAWRSPRAFGQVSLVMVESRPPSTCQILRCKLKGGSNESATKSSVWSYPVSIKNRGAFSA